jgi:hypothetical protein
VPDDDSSGLLRDPDDWFSQTFPDGDGFGDWVQQAGFEPDEGESGRLQIDADLSGASAWSSLSDADKQRAMLEDFRHQWSTPDPRRPSADDDLAATDEIVSDEGLDSAAAAEAEAEAEIQASIAAEGKVRRAMWRLAGLVAVILFIYGCTEVLGSDDDTVTSVDSGETQDVDTVPTDASEGATSEPDQQATASPDLPDPMAQPENYRVMEGPDGQAWLHVQFRGEWRPLTLGEFFSFFAMFSITLNPTVEVGWERHAGSEYVLGTTSEAYILEDGSVVFATGLFPTAPYELKIAARFGSWRDEAGPPAVFGEDSITVNSDSVETGDPLADLGGQPVFDLVAGN